MAEDCSDCSDSTLTHHTKKTGSKSDKVIANDVTKDIECHWAKNSKHM